MALNQRVLGSSPSASTTLPQNQARLIGSPDGFNARLVRAGLARTGKVLAEKLVRPTGFEPMAPRLGIWCSILLSYGRPALS